MLDLSGDRAAIVLTRLKGGVMIKRAIAAILVMVPFCTQAAAPTAAEVLRHMEANGGEATVTKFFSCVGDSESFNGYEQVASGSRAWVNVGLRVLPYTQGCEREGIYNSLALAMPRAPDLSLQLVTSNNARVACLPVSIEDDDVKGWVSHLARLEQALLKVGKPSLQQRKRLCMREIGMMRKALRKR